jgi:hypothetical protein
MKQITEIIKRSPTTILEDAVGAVALVVMLVAGLSLPGLI